MTLRYRSYQKELLDQDGIPFPDIERNMKELDTINTLLGGHAITLSGFQSLLGNRQNITVCEIGCGGGDNLVAIASWCRKKHISINCIGIDLKPECIEVGKARPELSGISQWITSDYAAVSFDSKPDIIFSSLFCHHFTEAQLVAQLQWMQVNSNAGFFINDLHRHWLAYHSIAFLTNIFSSSYLVKNDAPVSVTRGFLRSEWQEIIRAAGITYASVQWRWAFRHLVTARHPHA
jgi:2-polyprenyl-3-methyl-5-hydroxy-6-metoxy-1,4-benzoquinol methylase